MSKRVISHKVSFDSKVFFRFVCASAKKKPRVREKNWENVVFAKNPKNLYAPAESKPTFNCRWPYELRDNVRYTSSRTIRSLPLVCKKPRNIDIVYIPWVGHERCGDFLEYSSFNYISLSTVVFLCWTPNNRYLKQLSGFLDQLEQTKDNVHD